MMPLHSALHYAARLAQKHQATFHVVQHHGFDEGFAFVLPRARPQLTVEEVKAGLTASVARRIEANVSRFESIYAVMPDGSVWRAKRVGTIEQVSASAQEGAA